MKKALIRILALVMVMGFVGCSFTPAPDETNSSKATETTPVETESQTPEPTSELIVESTPEPTPEPSEELPMGETITVDNVAEITVDAAKYQDKIEYGYRTYATDKNDGDINLVVYVRYKNLGTETIEDFGMEIKGIRFYDLVYNGKYHYPAEYWIANDIAPLSTGLIFYYYVIPKEVEIAEGPLVAAIEINGKGYILTIR